MSQITHMQPSLLPGIQPLNPLTRAQEFYLLADRAGGDERKRLLRAAHEAMEEYRSLPSKARGQSRRAA